MNFYIKESVLGKILDAALQNKDLQKILLLEKRWERRLNAWGNGRNSRVKDAAMVFLLARRAVEAAAANDDDAWHQMARSDYYRKMYARRRLS